MLDYIDRKKKFFTGKIFITAISSFDPGVIEVVFFSVDIFL